MHIIAGKWKGRKLSTPTSKLNTTRPTTSRLRESFFNICRPYIEDAHFLDLFAGSGAMGLEALSQGAQFSTFIENDRNTAQHLQKNIRTFDSERMSSFLFGDVFQTLPLLDKRQKKFDLIFADPPYETFLPQINQYISQHLIQLIDRSSLLVEGGYFFVEEVKTVIPTLLQIPLKNLTLRKAREFGKTTLLEYRYEKPLLEENS